MRKANKAGRPSHEPTLELRKQVETMAGYGIRGDEIAMSIAISQPTLRKHYGHELDTGHIKANAAVAQSLYTKALGNGPQAVTAAIFWAKTRMGWKETTFIEVTHRPAEMSDDELATIARHAARSGNGATAPERNSSKLN